MFSLKVGDKWFKFGTNSTLLSFIYENVDMFDWKWTNSEDEGEKEVTVDIRMVGRFDKKYIVLVGFGSSWKRGYGPVEA